MLRELDAQLQKGDNPGAWTCVVIDDVPELFGTRGLVIKLRGAIDGEPFTGALMAQGDGTHRLPVKRRCGRPSESRGATPSTSRSTSGSASCRRTRGPANAGLAPIPLAASQLANLATRGLDDRRWLRWRRPADLLSRNAGRMRCSLLSAQSGSQGVRRTRRPIRQQQGSCGQRRQSCNAGFPCTAPSRRFARSTRGCKRLSTCWSGAGPAPRDLRRRQPLLDVRFGARLSGCREDAHCEQTTERVGERGGRLTRVLVEAGDGGR